jgi:uncharacterized protein YukE
MGTTITEDDLFRSRRRTALAIADGLVQQFPNLAHRTTGYDVDEAVEFIEMLIPLTACEADAELENLKTLYDSCDPKPPSLLQPLRDAVGMQQGTVKDVLTMAAELIPRLRVQVTVAREGRDTADSRAKESVQSQMAALRAEIGQLRETNTRLNRRCQHAEAAVADAAKVIARMEKHPWCGGSLGRAYLAHRNLMLTDRVEELVAVLERLSEAIDGLIHSSEGVADLHGNGDVATWESLCKGGRFEEWLLPWSDALELLAKVRQDNTIGTESQ